MNISNYISERTKSIDASGIRKVFDLAANLKDPINFSIGQPHYDINPEIKKVAITAIEEGFNRYTASPGIPELKEKILAKETELKKDGFDIMITSGVSGGIMLSLLVLINPGDEVLIPDPGFVSYKHVVTMAGGKPVFFDTYPDFRLHPERIKEHITEKTKCIIINSPSNPTGVVYSEEEIKAVAELCREHNMLPVSDEIYRTFSYDVKSSSIIKYFDEAVILRGFSKDYAMTGWRIGYAAGPSEIIEGMIKLQQFSFVHAPSFAQKACVAALDFSIEHEIESYRRKRDIIYNGLKQTFNMVRPEGAFYCFPEVPWGNGISFTQEAMSRNLLIVPGNVFSTRDTHIRISYAVGDDDLYKGIEVLNKMAKERT